MTLQEKVGARIKEIRIRKKLSQEEFSILSGIDRTFISHIEKGHRNISLGTIEKIADGLSVNVLELFTSKRKSQK